MRLKPPSSLIYLIAHSLLRTLRVHRFGTRHLRQAVRLSSTRTVIYCFWHQSILYILAPHQNLRLKVAALASLSGDGQIIADYLARVGIRTVRGSSARGSAKAVKEIYGILSEGWHLVIASDGPRGPAKQAKSGTVEICRRHQIALVPVAARASSEISFSSWDGFRMPMPGAQIALLYGEPILYPPQEVSADVVEERARELSRTLNSLEAQASRLVRRYAPRSRFRPLL
jgi:lysophospholipid acyltransferase (LPLAT)-like uncharacterized protein